MYIHICAVLARRMIVGSAVVKPSICDASAGFMCACYAVLHSASVRFSIGRGLSSCFVLRHWPTSRGGSPPHRTIPVRSRTLRRDHHNRVCQSPTPVSLPLMTSLRRTARRRRTTTPNTVTVATTSQGRCLSRHRRNRNRLWLSSTL
ncbi:hypothetical protein BD310DRAFT_362067 [Dichomitus squalens]|uniref:Uncharacterized protein n=1 Tax=Dichomitus squalens TaxID=114155 RepID=A0A4Q9PZ65_9APHY|nr:hypothetical protein BD310DRAFT_362067 [Dichomitus squalens]